MIVAAFVHSLPGHSSTLPHPPLHPGLPYMYSTVCALVKIPSKILTRILPGSQQGHTGIWNTLLHLDKILSRFLWDFASCKISQDFGTYPTKSCNILLRSCGVFLQGCASVNSFDMSTISLFSANFISIISTHQELIEPTKWARSI